MATVGDIVNEAREDIPLKRKKKTRSFYSCNDECMSGSRYINFAFGTLTFIITLALFVQIHYGDYQVIPHGSVATDSFECSEIGTSILKQGGNSIDAAIASAFCLAVTTPHLTGLDAEGQLLFYNHKYRTPPTIIDFSGSSRSSEDLPRLVLGLAYIHKEYGTRNWKSLVLPAAKLAREGYLVSKMLVQAVTKGHAEDLYGPLEAGQMLQHENLAKTLERIANTPEKELYSHLNAINQPSHSRALKGAFYGYNVFVPNTSSGPLLLHNLQEIGLLNFTKEDVDRPGFVFNVARSTQTVYLEEKVSNKFHEGTLSSVAVIDTDELYVSLVTGMYAFFGSGEITIYGYVPDAKKQDKACSRLPLIITDANFICGRRMVFGANTVAQATQLVVSLVLAGKNAIDVVEAPRFHMLGNGSISIEASRTPAFSNELIRSLSTFSPKISPAPEPYPSSNIVEKYKDDLISHSDSRGGGIASRY
nr:unnamed protein product [Callosobruchus chinensis]